MDTVNFLGQECCVLESDTLKLLVTRSVGPRILSLQFRGSENLFAELPDFVTECPGSGTFHFYGGHRLWHAPEDQSRTYLPDDAPVEIDPTDDGWLVTQQTEAKTGLQKSIEIRLLGEAQLVVTHQIANRGLWDVTCSLWALTQLKTGGMAILPQRRTDTGVLPNRSLALWHYSDMSNPNARWGSNYVLLHASMDAPFKIGFPNPRGWLAYWRDGMLFVKQAEYNADAQYYDYSSSSECYCNARFIELETLSPITTIVPGAAATHAEVWNLYSVANCPRDEAEVQRLAEELGLE